MNFILIVLDTLRRDRLSFYRDERVRQRNQSHKSYDVPWEDQLAYTPNLDALARRATVFDNYYVASFPTMPARADYSTGKTSFSFMTWEPLSRDEATMADVLSEAGYVTAGVVDTPFYQKNGYGYDRGYKYFQDMGSQLPYLNLSLPKNARYSEYEYCAPETFTQAEKTLESIYTQKFFLLIDSWDPHEPWDPPVWYGQRYNQDYEGSAVLPPYSRYQEAGLTERDLELARAGFQGEITMVDRFIGRIVERLETLGVADDTAIVIVSDHGFYFGEHEGLFGKMIREEVRSFSENPMQDWLRSPLYEELVHVPMMIALPDRQHRRVYDLVSAVDLMPTILDLAGVEQPEGSHIHGKSVAGFARGEPGEGREMVVSAVPLMNPGQDLAVVDSYYRVVREFQPVTITVPDWSMLYSARDEPLELYHLPSDPRQQRNVAEENPGTVREMHGRYVELLKELKVAPHLLEPRSEL